MYMCIIITPGACARGKVIGCVVIVVIVVVVHTISWDLGTSATQKYNESVKIGEKLASGCLESSGTARLQPSQIVYCSWLS